MAYGETLMRRFRKLLKEFGIPYIANHYNLTHATINKKTIEIRTTHTGLSVQLQLPPLIRGWKPSGQPPDYSELKTDDIYAILEFITHLTGYDWANPTHGMNGALQETADRPKSRQNVPS